MIPEDIPWLYVLPALLFVAFIFGLVYKRFQDKAVEVVRDTLTPGEHDVSDLQEYIRRHHKAA